MGAFLKRKLHTLNLLGLPEHTESLTMSSFQSSRTFLPGWGDAVSMEYRLRVASEDECLEWASELWQLELVAKARGYPRTWAARIVRNRATWRELFQAKDEGRAPSFEWFTLGSVNEGDRGGLLD
jgi:hypothetical protein